MKPAHRRWGVWGLLILPIGLLSGCNILAPIYFVAIMAGMDPRLPAKFKFPSDAGRIAVVTNADLGTQIESGHIDHDLNKLISQKLYDSFQRERKFRDIKVITAGTVAKWQDEHDNWRTVDPVEIGRALKADYVIYVDIEDIQFCQDPHSKQLFQGRADVSIRVVKVDDGEGEVVLPPEFFTSEFPRGRPIPAGDSMTLAKFRRIYLDRLAEHIIWYFVPHDSVDEFSRDNPVL